MHAECVGDVRLCVLKCILLLPERFACWNADYAEVNKQPDIQHTGTGFATLGLASQSALHG